LGSVAVILWIVGIPLFPFIAHGGELNWFLGICQGEYLSPRAITSLIKSV
jgi:hypothetical protein